MRRVPVLTAVPSSSSWWGQFDLLREKPIQDALRSTLERENVGRDQHYNSTGYVPGNVGTSMKSLPRTTAPRKCARAASIHMRSVMAGSSGGTRWDRTSTF